MATVTLDKQPGAFLDELIPSDSLYHQLHQLEREIDSKIHSKQIQIADASFKTAKVKRTLKLFISNTVEDIAAAEGQPPTLGWALRLEGKLETYGRHGRLANRKLTEYFEAVHIEFESPSTGQPELIEWKNGPGVAESDGFEIRRLGVPQNRLVTIVLRMENQPERFKLASELAAVLGMTSGSRPEVVLALWQYIKLHKLQESDEKKQILNDGPLKALFGCEKMSFSDIPNVIQPHLMPLDPVVIEYDLDLEHGGLLVYDVEVDLDDPSKSRPPVSPSIAAIQREIGLIDQKMAECINSMKTAQAAAKILEAFAADPVACVNNIVARQTADYETVIGDVSINAEDLNKASVYEGDDIEQAVTTMLQSLRPF